MFCNVLGAVYLLLGVVGFVLGDGEGRMFHLIPGALELGTMDHIIHVVLAAIFVFGGFTTRADAPAIAT